MFLTVHVAAGMAVATAATHNPAAAFALGAASHFLIDIIPHGDEFIGEKQGTLFEKAFFFSKFVAADLAAGFFLFMALVWAFPQSDILLLVAAGVGAALPDALQFSQKYREKVHHFFHEMIGRRIDFGKGLAIQAALFLAFSGWLVFLLG